MLFVLWLAPLGWLQVPWLGLLIAQGYLLTRTFERGPTSFLLRIVGL